MENHPFENPLAEIDPASPTFFEPINEIKSHFPDPDYRSPSNNQPYRRWVPWTGSSNNQPHRRWIPWTEDEHRLFLMGLNKYGKGDWKNISRYYVMSKTPTQVASHAQRFFKRETCSTPLDKRRRSIHDIQDVNQQWR